MTGKQKWLVGGAVASVLVASAVLILIPRKAPSFEKDSLLKEITSTVKKSQAKIEEADFADLEGIVSQLKSGPAKALLSQLSPETQSLIESFQPSEISPQLQQSLLKDLNAAMEDNNFYGGLKEAGEKSGQDIEGKLSGETRQKKTQWEHQGTRAPEHQKDFNQAVLEDIYPSTHQMLQNPEPESAKKSLSEIQQDPTQYLHQRLSNETQKLAKTAFIPKEISEKLKQQLAKDLNQAIENPNFYAALEESAKKQGEDLEKKLSGETQQKKTQWEHQSTESASGGRTPEHQKELNRAVVEDLFGEKILKSREQQKAIAKAVADPTARTDQKEERTGETNKPAVQPQQPTTPSKTTPPATGTIPAETKPPVPGELNLLPGTEPFKLDSKGNAYVPGEIVVQISDRTNIDSVIQQLKGDVNIIGAEPVFHQVDSSALQRYYTLKVDNKEDIEQLSERLKQTGLATVAEPNYYAHAQGEVRPNDPFYKEQWGLEKIKAPEAWEKIKDAPEVLVAVIDSGIDYNHPDLKDNIYINPKEISDNKIDDDGNGLVDDVMGWDFVNNDNDVMDDNGHGTHVSGIIGAVGNNGVGVAGVNWKVKILPIKGLSDSGNGENTRLADAIVYAANMGARVINNSWRCPGKSQLIADAVQYAYAGNPEKNIIKNCVVVVIAGNDNRDCSSYDPASLPTVITVSASDPNDKKGYFSNYGGPVDLAAPGAASSDDVGAMHEQILSTFPLKLKPDNWKGEAGYNKWQGTSMAAPHVAGAAAMILAYYEKNGQKLSNEQVRQILRNTADKVISPEWEPTLGSGRLNVAKALSLDPEKLPPAANISELKGLDVFGLAYAGGGASLKEWKLEVKPPPLPDGVQQKVDWMVVASGKSEFRSTPVKLGQVNLIDNFDQGQYTLRLTVVDSKEQVAEDTAQYFMKKVYIKTPISHQFFRKGDLIEIKGTVVAPNLDRYEFFYQKYGSNPEKGGGNSWQSSNQGVTLVDSGRSPILDGLLATIDTSKISDGDGWYILKGYAHYQYQGSSVTCSIEGESKMTLFVVDSTILPGWPVKVSDHARFNGNRVGMVIGEIDKTKPGLEVAVGTPWPEFSPQMTVVGSNGKILPHWPLMGQAQGMVATPRLVDIDGDGDSELIFSNTVYNNSVSNLYIYKKDGTSFANGSPLLNHKANDLEILGSGGDIKILAMDTEGHCYLLNKSKTMISSRKEELSYATKVVPVDLNGDGKLELCANVGTDAFGRAPFKYGIGVFDLNGASLPGWPYYFKEEFETSFLTSPVFADFDGDGQLEIVFMAHWANGDPSRLYVLRNNGTLFPGWPQSFRGGSRPGTQRGCPAIGDIDGDKKPEIVVAAGCYLYAFKSNGTLLAGWPKQTQYPFITDIRDIPSHPILADVDGDGISDVIFPDQERIYALRWDGKNVPGFPKACPVYALGCAVTDLNQDGRTDLVAYGGNGAASADNPTVFAWDLGIPYHPEANDWPFRYHDVEQTCVYKPADGAKKPQSAGLTVQFYPPQILSFTDPKTTEYSYGFGLLKEAVREKEANWDVNNDWDMRDWLKDASGTYVWTKLTQINTENRYGYIDIATKDAEGKISATYRYRFAPRGELNKDPHHALPGEPLLLNHPDFGKVTAPATGENLCGQLREVVNSLQNDTLPVSVRTTMADELGKTPVSQLQQCGVYNEAVAALVALLKTSSAGAVAGGDCAKMEQLTTQLRDPNASAEARLKAIQELGQLGTSVRQCPNYAAAVAALLDVLTPAQRLQRLDLNGDGVLDVGDLEIIKRNFGTSGPEGDVDGNGIVDIADVALVSRAIEQGIVSVPETGRRRRMNARAALPDAPAVGCDQIAESAGKIADAKLPEMERLAEMEKIKGMGAEVAGCTAYNQVIDALLDAAVPPQPQNVSFPIKPAYDDFLNQFIAAVKAPKDPDLAKWRKTISAAWDRVSYIRPRDPRLAPPLLEYLGLEPEPAWWPEAILALGETGSPDAYDPLIKFTNQPLIKSTQYPENAEIITTRIRVNAVSALGALHDIRAVDPLIALCKDADPLVRKYAPISLGKLGDKRAVDIAISLLQDSDPEVRFGAAYALGDLKDPRAIKPLAQLINIPVNGHAGYQRMAASAIRDILRATGGGLKDDEVFNLLLTALNDPKTNESVREGVAMALGVAVDPRAVDPLLKAAQDPSSSYGIKSAAFNALAHYKDDRIKTLAIAELNNPNSNLIWDAARVLAKSEGINALGALIGGFSNPKKDASDFIQKVIIRDIGVPAVEPLIDALGNNDPAIRQGVANTLTGFLYKGSNHDPAVDVALKKALKEHSNPAVRVEVAKLWEWYNWKTEDFNLLLSLLNDSEKIIRKLGARALGDLKDSRSVDPLINALNDSELEVVYAAMYALSQSKDPRAVYPLAQLLNDPRVDKWSVAVVLRDLMDDGVAVDPRAVDPLIKALAINYSPINPIIKRALVAIGGPAVPSLKNALNSDDYSTRNAAQEVLNTINEKVGGAS